MFTHIGNKAKTECIIESYITEKNSSQRTQYISLHIVSTSFISQIVKIRECISEKMLTQSVVLNNYSMTECSLGEHSNLANTQ